MPIDTKLMQKLMEADEKYNGEELAKIFGPTLLSWPTDSSRMYMFTANLKQTLTLLDPDVAHIQTGHENLFGKYSNGYKKLDGTWKVIEVINKFANTSDRKYQIVSIVLYNKTTDTYDIIEKPVAENLTEKFGYVFNTTNIDSLSVGDVITDEILYKSTAYDEHMNYRIGKNANVMYIASPDTIEDAQVVRKGWAESIKSVEVEKVYVMVNDNDVMLNLYGDDDNYLPFPDIGNPVINSMLCATRQINKHRVLFDFQKSHMQEVMDTDTDYYVTKDAIVSDINIYYNGEEDMPESLYYSQIKRYYEDNRTYADNIMKVLDMIKTSGSKYTKNVSYMRSRYKNYNNREYLWKNKDKAFSHILIEFSVTAVVGLHLGSKLTGRYGNKGVISEIIDDDVSSVAEYVEDNKMPYYIAEDGEKVYADILFNSSGAIRRLNSIQLTETETNFIAEQVRRKIKIAKSLDEKVELAFKFLDAVNTDMSTYFRTLCNRYDTSVRINNHIVNTYSIEEKEFFIRDIENNGFYIVRSPESPLLFDDVIRLYELFPDIKPVSIYTDIFGMQEREMIRKGIIGSQYILVLKQNTNKNFSARSTFRVNRSNIPVKDTAKKTNRSSYARTPINISEIHNLLASVSAQDLAEWNLFMRSSALARKSLDRILDAADNPLGIVKLKIQDNYTNANVDGLRAKLKTMGLRLHISDIEDGYIKVYDDSIHGMNFGPYMVYDKVTNRPMYNDLFSRYTLAQKENFIISDSRIEKSKYIWNKVFEDESVLDKYDISDELKANLILITAGKIAEIEDKVNSEVSVINQPIADEEKTIRRRGRRSKVEIVQDDTGILEDEISEIVEDVDVVYDEDDSAEPLLDVLDTDI